MKIATSRVSPQGQISVPAEVRARLGLAPGSTIEWDLEGDVIQVRRAGRFSSEDIHAAVFGGKKPRKVSIEEMDDAIGAHLKQKHARR
jgi:AbrB family looped-hinge helix DNA binding protein